MEIFSRFNASDCELDKISFKFLQKHRFNDSECELEPDQFQISAKISAPIHHCYHIAYMKECNIHLCSNIKHTHNIVVIVVLVTYEK